MIVISCREVQPLPTTSELTGYELKGTVTTQNGIPIGGVDVDIYYNTEQAGTTATDTVQVIVTDSTHIVDVAVYNSNYEFVRQLYLGYLSPGVVPRFGWDGTDQNQVPVPSGKYLIRYGVNNVLIKFSTVIIEGHRTATTDRFGRFNITSDHLPIDEVFDSYLSDGTYYVTLRILPFIDLEFRKQGLHQLYPAVELTKDKITNAVFTLP
ncbi:MAG: hypothetical protein HYR76_06590 [Ignavibacteria bacterium]|nr:hypothetical protein [Ignavibacteria bacterium]MBI3766542.1 hypothetical protein [Ignavibacteriales bacterium]